jgi:hypothetical protein
MYKRFLKRNPSVDRDFKELGGEDGFYGNFIICKESETNFVNVDLKPDAVRALALNDWKQRQKHLKSLQRLGVEMIV